MGKEVCDEKLTQCHRGPALVILCLVLGKALILEKVMQRGSLTVEY